MIKCGFYNSKNGDRKYNAEDMTQPYKRLVSDGVYAMPAGQLKVTAAGGMKIQVSAGAAKIGSRWLESDAIETFTLDPSDVALNQIYSVVIRDDNSENVRSGSIALKKGSLASNPIAPEIERSENITELKIAEVRVNKLVEEVTDADIKDTRADTTVCGWVTGLIEQVDTSDLFTQWESAYEQEHQRQQEQITNNQWEFDRWFDNVKDTFLTQATIVRRKTSEITTQSSGVKVIDINISDFNQDLDVLSVFVNGFKIPESEYTYNATQITLNKALDIGSVVLVEALKSIDGKDAETTMQEYVKQEASANAAIENANAAAEEARTTAAATATNTVNAMKGQPNGIASISVSGELEQAPPQSVMFLAAHPIGSLFETTISTNPGTLYGGTWAAWGGGRVPVGVNTADSDFNTVEKTGGKKTERHEFKVGYKGYFGSTVGSDDNMIQAYKYSTSSYGTYAYEGSTQASVNAGIQASTNTRDVAQASSTGDTSETSIVQPYITCYIWKRTT